MNIVYHVDCMEYMKTLPDRFFDLAVVDPPYGCGLSVPSIKVERRGCGHNKYDIKVHRSCKPGGDHKTYEGSDIRHWDVAPPPEYFNELARVSKNQIIWGGNYFYLPPTCCFLVWRKLSIADNFTMAMAEYAWTSFNANAKVFEAAPQGTKSNQRFHPTQKPVALYEWIYRLFAEPSDKILDTHLGSGSSRIAAFNMGLDFVGCEIDDYYFTEQEKRFQEHAAQGNLFIRDEYIQESLFKGGTGDVHD